MRCIPHRRCALVARLLKSSVLRVVSTRRGLSMNFSRWFLSVILLGLSSSMAMADGVDPSMGLGGGGSQGPFNQTACAPDSCTISLDSTGSGVVEIINNTPFDLASLTINVETSFGDNLTCLADTTFGYPSVSGGGAFGTSCTYSDTLPVSTSILTQQHYDILFNGYCTGSRGGPCGAAFLSSLTFDLTWTEGTNPNPAPEPSTVVLLWTGLVTLGAGRKRLGRALVTRLFA
jgi:hypothetical protein